MAKSLAEQIEEQKRVAADARRKIAELKQKAREAQAKRFARIAEKVGFFEVEITDEQLETAIRDLVSSTRKNDQGEAIKVEDPVQEHQTV